MSSIEQTLSIIKPDAVERNIQDQIKNEFKNNGFEILNENSPKFYKITMKTAKISGTKDCKFDIRAVQRNAYLVDLEKGFFF